MDTSEPEPLSPNQLAHLRAQELRMVAGLIEAAGQHELAAEARDRALEIDPPAGCA